MSSKLLKTLPVLVVIVIILGIGSINGVSEPQIELSTDSFDLGDINPADGLRVETFLIKNVGGQSLEIKSVSTSCGCTSAEVESEVIPPYGQTSLIVTYDPSVHPEYSGVIRRVVYIKSNDPVNKEVELELTGNQLPSEAQA